MHIGHFDELACSEGIAEKHACRPAVSIRLNLETTSLPRWDRFGFHVDNGQARDAVRRLPAGGRLRLTGLHVHPGTFILDARAFAEATRKVVAFANHLRSELGIVLDTLDLGGGLTSRNRLHSQYLPSDQYVPSLAEYDACLGWAHTVGDIDATAPADYRGNSRLAYILYSMGRYGAAAGRYAIVLARYPSDVEMRAGLGWSLRKQGRTADARSAFDAVLQVAPSHVSAREGLDATASR